MGLTNDVYVLFLRGGYNDPSDCIATLDDCNAVFLAAGRPEGSLVLPLCVCPYAQTEWPPSREW